MKISIKYNNIEHSLEIDDDSKRGAVETCFKRLMICVGYSYSDTEAQEIILDSNSILGVN